jgi:hypothetical protein
MFSRRYRQRRSVGACDSCGSDFVHPVTWEEQDESHWWMLLHCGACDNRYDAVLTDDAATAFDEKLGQDELLIARAADVLHNEWRSAEVSAFAAAIQHDLITADDFAR